MNDEPTIGVRMTSAGQACDYDRCSVLVFNPEGPRTGVVAQTGCPSCGRDGFPVRFGVAIDKMTTEESP